MAKPSKASEARERGERGDRAERVEREAERRRGAPPARRAGTLGFALTDTADVVRRIERGFAYEAVLRLRKRLDLPLEEVADYVRITPRTLSRRKDEGRLRPEESERVLRVSRVVDLAVDLFEGDVAATRRWLSTPKRALGGATPLDYARTEVGAREVERLIGRLEHGVYS